jgi:hypothetical protein
MATRKLSLTRDQLATFLGNHELIKQFEGLFQIADEISPATDTQGISLQAGNAEAAANEALAKIAQLAKDSAINDSIADQKATQALSELERIANALELIAGAPAVENNNSVKTDYIDMRREAPNSQRIARMSWDNNSQTAKIGLDYSVLQRVGLDTYARVENTTGSTIPKGDVVGFAGVGPGGVLSVEPYIADGSVPSLYILGVMAHDLPNSGEIGYCSVWGHIEGIDTSAFSVGDVLYASPTTPGALTATKPTAPDEAIPVAAVLVDDATDGAVFVRPTVEQDRHYGVFSDTTTQTPAAVYTPYAVTFDTTDYASGVSIGSPTSEVNVSQSGLYRFDFSLQIESGSASAKKLWIWPRVNGTDIPNSNSEITVSGSNTVLVPAWLWVLSMNANDYFELMYAVDDTNISIVAKAAQAGSTGTATFARPAVPSAILEVTQVQQ